MLHKVGGAQYIDVFLWIHGSFVELDVAEHFHSYVQCFAEHSSTVTYAKDMTKSFPMN